MPRPVQWRRNQKRRFEDFLQQEIHNALGDREGLERRWANYIEQYVAPRRGSIDFPFAGASNEELPLTAMHAEPVLAQMMQSLHAPRNIWTAIDLSGEFTESVNAITEYLTVIDRLFLKMRSVNRRAFPDGIILGTMVYHPTWLFQRRPKIIYDEEGEPVKDVEIIDRPVVRHIPLTDFIWPANAWSVDPDAAVAPAQWVGHRFELTENALRAMGKGQEPFLPNFDSKVLEEVLKREEDIQEEDSVDDKIHELDDYEPFRDRKITLYRVEARFDVDDDGIDEDVIVIWHQGLGRVLQAIHPTWEHGKRLYEVEQYMQTFSLLGMGIAEMDEWAQAASSKLLNMGINNSIIANTRMFGFPEGMNISPDEAIYPGKGFALPPGEQIQSIQLGEVYPSIFQFLEALQAWSEQRTSVNELRTGNITGLPSRTPATTVLSLLQEGNKKFDMILSNWRTGAIANIGKRVLQMIAQRFQAGEQRWGRLAQDMLGPNDAARVIEVLSLPATMIEEGLGIEVTTTSSQVNKEVEKQSMVGLAQFAQQNLTASVQAAQLIDQIGLQSLTGQVTAASYNANREILRRVYDAFDIENSDPLLPPPMPDQQQGAAANGAQQQQPAAGGQLAPVPTDQQLALQRALLGF